MEVSGHFASFLMYASVLLGVVFTFGIIGGAIAEQSDNSDPKEVAASPAKRDHWKEFYQGGPKQKNDF